MPVLYGLEERERVSYRNLGDPREENWQNAYWGRRNYGRLEEIKRVVDEEGLFVGRRGVGSDEWDGEGMCRKGDKVSA